MKPHYLLLFIAVLFGIEGLFAQKTYKKAFGGPDNGEWQSDLKTMKDIGYLIAGSTDNFGAGNYDAYCVKLNKAGEMLWSKTYGTPLTEFGTKCRGTSDGGFLISFYSKNPQSVKDSGIFVLKCDVNGNVQWSRFMSNAQPLGIEPAHLYESKQGDYYVLCDWYTGYYDNHSFALIKLRRDGKLVWTKAVDTQPLAYFNSTQIGELNNGDIVVAGNSFGDNWATYGSYIHLFLLSSETGSIRQCKKIELINGGYSKSLFIDAFVVENNILHVSGGYAADGFYYKVCGFSARPDDTIVYAAGIAAKNRNCFLYLKNKGIIKQPEGGFTSNFLFTNDGGYMNAQRYSISRHSATGYDILVYKFDSLGRTCPEYAIPTIDTTMHKTTLKITDKSYKVIGDEIIIKDSTLVVTDVTAQTIACTGTAPDESRIISKAAAPSAKSINYFTIYPNPAKDILHITGLKDAAKLTIINTLGVVVKIIAVHTADGTINIKDLPAGKYYLQVQGSSGTVTKPFVKE